MKRLFEVKAAGVRYGEAEVVRSATFTLHEGEFVAIAGPNGAGKTTLLTLLAGLHQPSSGECLFFGKAAYTWDRREFARRIALIMQVEQTAFPFTAEEVVAMGRMPHATGLFETAEDHAAVTRALAATEMEHLRSRDFRTLSGGEKQRILLASALAQQPEVLLLDEPSNHLDLQHQLSLHRMLRNLSREGMLVVAVTHDLNLAAAYAGRVVLMKEGQICLDGTPAEVLNASSLRDIFRVQAQLHHTPSGQPWLIYGE